MSYLNTLTIDVEDYYQVSAFESVVDRRDWDRYESRVERNTRRLLSILAEHGVQATFFVLGWVAERHPQLVKEIQREGHEVACHGYAHQLIYRHPPESFRQDIRKAKRILEDLCGEPVVGSPASGTM